MTPIGQSERLVQNRVIQLLESPELGWDFKGDWHDRENRNVEEEFLLPYLERQGHSSGIIDRVRQQVFKAASSTAGTLYERNKEFYRLLRYGVQVKEDAGENKQTVHLINWKDPGKNHFFFAEEVTVLGEKTKRPDLVFYVNGIALGVLELKRSTKGVCEGIQQNLDNQSTRFIQHFFNTMQLVMAGNDTQGLRYATIETKAKYWLGWKEDGEGSILLDQHIQQVMNKKRFLELLHDFIVYDRGIKKLCRHNQYFGVKAAQNYVRKREGGVIWHTQGSGKSLTMVWLAKWVLENLEGSRILILTDRDELDKQIEKVFKGVELQIVRAKSGADLVNKLNTTEPSLFCSLIHKFGRSDEGNVDQYLEELRRSLPKDFSAKGDLVVFVDECHRTQSGKLHQAMRTLLPNALLIGFTGTPLLKQDKQKSVETFGPYIHTYKFNEAVKDGVVLDLRYEARRVDQFVTNAQKIDQWFEAKTRGLTDYARSELKKRWGTMQKVLSSRDRLGKIVGDILLDMETKERLQNGRGNAMLVCDSIYEACKYYEIFQNNGFSKCAIVTSYVPNAKEIKGEGTGSAELTERLKQYDIYTKMLGGKEPEVFEDEVKKTFIDEPAQMKLLIVVDKLLTGFDAPPATFLYIDKKMQDHGLFQAICRVNRLDGDDKDYGYIIDYKALFENIEKAVDDYTTEAFSGYDSDDVKGLLKDRLKSGRQDLDDALESIRTLCEPVEAPRDTQAYIRYFCGDTSYSEDLSRTEERRIALYKLTVNLIRAYASLANEMIPAGYTEAEAAEIKVEVSYYETVRGEIKIASGDAIDLKSHEPAMRHLIDNYLGANDSEKVSGLNDMSLVELLVEKGEKGVESLPASIRKNPQAMAETIENNLRRAIVEEAPSNPKYFENMSSLLEELIQQRKKEVDSYAKYLTKLVQLTQQVKKPAQNSYPATLTTKAMRALFDNLSQDEAIAIAVHQAILSTKKDEWRGKSIKEREIKVAIRKVLRETKPELAEDEALDKLFELVKNQNEY